MGIHYSASLWYGIVLKAEDFDGDVSDLWYSKIGSDSGPSLVSTVTINDGYDTPMSAIGICYGTVNEVTPYKPLKEVNVNMSETEKEMAIEAIKKVCAKYGIKYSEPQFHLSFYVS